MQLEKIMFFSFAALFFFVPLILWPNTSEVFEFNKMVLTYILTVVVLATWIVRSILVKKTIFRRTIFDIPLLVFIASQLIATILSIDPRTSFFGYYSRFNGGLLSTLCYAVLYWAFVSNFDEKSTKKLIIFSLLPGALLVSIYGILEHFGIDKDIWVQDVQTRVFSTLGQPNWLAAWLTALIPLPWSFALTSKSNVKNKTFWIYLALSIIFSWAFIFTKSRSGLLGFAAMYLIFWITYLGINRKNIKKLLPPFAIITISLLAIGLISGTQFTPSLKSLLDKRTTESAPTTLTGPALEVGGTESGAIRKIVWKGAFEVWKNYPITGSGVETFAYSYYKFRPVEHNLVSEWDFIYNKAHNEFLNIAANSGTLGLISYLSLIGGAFYIFVKRIRREDPLSIALLAGYTSLLITNFFGFSVVPTQLQFFLFPAIAIAYASESQRTGGKIKIETAQKLLIGLILLTVFYLLIAIGRYWLADIYYAKGKNYNGVNRPDISITHLTNAIRLSPHEPLYHNEIASSYTMMAQIFNQAKDENKTRENINLAIEESEKAVRLSPNNVNLKRSQFGIFIRLSLIDPNYLLEALKVLEESIPQAPTDAKLLYNLGLTYARTGQLTRALEVMEKTIEIKSNYKDARLALALLLIERGEKDAAREQLEYILEKIDPNDSLTKQTLESI